MRVLKNLSRNLVEKNVRGKIYKIKPKGSLTIESSMEDEIGNNLLQTYGFLEEITPEKTYQAPKSEEVRKVVRPAVARVVRKKGGLLN